MNTTEKNNNEVYSYYEIVIKKNKFTRYCSSNIKKNIKRLELSVSHIFMGLIKH